MSNKISLTVQGGPEYMTVCNSVAIAAANIANIGVESIEDIGVAVFEGCKMISCHNSECWCDEYKIEFYIDEKFFKIIISSIGEYNLEKCKDICSMCPKEGDLGLAIMNTIMDNVEFSMDENEKKKIIMIKNI